MTMTGMYTFGRTRRITGALAMILVGAIFAVVGIGLLIGSFFARSGADVSAYTQSHGVHENAIVQNVAVTTQDHCSNSTSGRHGFHSSTSQNCSVTYDARITVTLPRPVSGQSTSVVHVGQNVSYARGQAVAVLVDPKEPGYAELPGQPYTTTATVLVLAIVGGVLLVVGAVLCFFGVRLRLSRRRRAAMAGE